MSRQPLWAKPRMRASQHCDLRRSNLIPDEIREAMQNSAPDAAIQFRIDERCRCEARDNRNELDVEIGGQARSLLLIPLLGLSHVTFSRATDMD